MTYLDYLDAGLAPHSAPHLYVPSEPITEDEARRDPLICQGINLIQSHVDPASALGALGMAYPQLALAGQRSVRILGANLGMADYRAESKQASAMLFFDPYIEPIEEEGTTEEIEYCYSAPGIAVIVRRWNAVRVHVTGRPPITLRGVDARILQHEVHHLDGILCIEFALQQGEQIYVVPPTMKRAFQEPAGRRAWPFVFPNEQRLAMISGEFDLATYKRYL